jgi:hypothetical protein
MDSGARYLPLKPVIEGHPSRDDIRQQTSEVGFPIRKSADQSLFAAPHGLSQRTTSFIACVCQGIHRTPFCHFIALIINARRPMTPRLSGSSREERTASSTRPSRQRGSGPPAASNGMRARTDHPSRMDRSGKTSVTREFSVGHAVKQAGLRPSAPEGERPKNSSLHDVSQQATTRDVRMAAKDLLSTSGMQRAGMVEPDGIEPTTSCLQSTRSPN